MKTGTHSSAPPILDSIAGTSSWAKWIREEICEVAPHRSTVMITGPSGTGKELIARAIHAQSFRAGNAFIPVNCAAVTGTLFTSHMFGHVKGAFTGAHQPAVGCFRAADGGTIFLDEIGEIEWDVQAKLLRVLQERSVVPVGSHDEVRVDVRVITATHRDLDSEVAEGRFREDLYYRLNIISIATLPLKDRPEDIPVLADHFLARLSIRNGIPLKRLAPDVLAALYAYSWPGNVRELENVLERAVVYSKDDVIRRAALPDHLQRPPSDRAIREPVAVVGADETRMDPEGSAGAWLTLAEVECEHIRTTLERTDYNQTAAARLLGMDRNVLRRRVAKYGLDVTRSTRGRPRSRRDS